MSSSEEQRQVFIFYRKKIYAGINGTKGKLIKLKKSGFLNKEEKLAVQQVIDSVENLRQVYLNSGK